jgi:hypothetical protein
MKKILGSIKASAASVKIFCVHCCDFFLEKMEMALNIWLKDDTQRWLSLDGVSREKGSVHSSNGWCGKLEMWMSTYSIKTIEPPSADCVAGAKFP